MSALLDLMPWLAPRSGVVSIARPDLPRALGLLRGARYAVATTDVVVREEDLPDRMAVDPQDFRLDRLDKEDRPRSGALWRREQAAIARALRLPEPAERNLDALLDLATDLTPADLGGATGLVLVWSDAGFLESLDPEHHEVLVEILEEIHHRLADTGLVFETLTVGATPLGPAPEPVQKEDDTSWADR